MLILEALVYLLLIFLSLILIGLIVLYLTTNRYPKVHRFESENYFYNPKNDKTEPFPSIEDNYSLHLSVIIPAYNEEERLPVMLDECLEYLTKREKSGLSFEIIVVSDGSKDRTVEVAHSYAKKYDCIRVLALEQNRGKGGAVRLGMQSARGSVLLFADADGATKFCDLEKLEDSLKNILEVDYVSHADQVSISYAVICGSRAHLQDTDVKRTLFRLILMHGFHFLVWFFCVRKVKDTQCGFKLLTRESARIIFNALHIERWAFDVEMLYIAESLKMPIAEVGVNWMEIEGSKLTPFWSWLQMGRDLLLIWLKYRVNAWKIAKPKTS